MAAVAVTADNARVNDANSTTNWGNVNGGGGISNEVDITYQGGIAQSRKISTSLIGRDYDPGAGAVDMTGTDRNVCLFKITATNPGVLLSRTSPGLHVYLGDSNASFNEYYVAGNDNYPPRGGWLLVPIDPNVSGYRDVDGSVTLTAIDYFAVMADFSAGSKAENVAIDAIDIGAGLHLVGGDGADPDGDFADFADADEGTSTNRWGYVFTQGSALFVNGRLSIGENVSETAVATVFQATDAKVFWNNGYFATGFARLRINLGNATTDVDLIRCTFVGEGELNNTLGLGYTTTEDTRPVFEATGTSGALDLDACNLQNFSDVILTSVCGIDGGAIQTAALTQATAHIRNAIITTTSLTSIATLQDPTFGVSSGIHDCVFKQGGAGHALELSAVGATVTLTNVTFTGYGADTTDDAAIDVTAASGTTTINWSGGTAPTYKTAGATVVVQNTVNVGVTAVDAGVGIEGARVHLFADTGGDLPVDAVTTIARVTTVATATSTAHGLTAGQLVQIAGADQAEYNGVKTIDTVPTANTFTFAVSGSPTTPATGTITSTGFIINGLTSAAGLAENAGWPFSSSQPVVGFVRKGTSVPTYKTAALLGTITSAGLSITAPMISDD